MHAYLNGVFNLFDVPIKDAKQKRRELAQQGWIITFSEVI